MEKLPSNYSVVENQDSSLQHVEGKRYIDTETSNEYYKLLKEPEMQFIVSQLAAMVIPVANVYKEGDNVYSPSATDHPDYKAFPTKSIRSRTMSRKDRESYNPTEEDKYFLDLIFEDRDHSDNSNSAGSILFDFNNATIDKDNWKTSKERIEDTIDWLDSEHSELASGVRQKVAKFKLLIEGSDGLDFLSALVFKSGYAGSAEDIQRKLISRCDLVLGQTQAT